MSIADLISTVLESIRLKFYTNDGVFRVREYKRDERALMKAITTYGYTCHQRGWEFKIEDIQNDLLKLLLTLKTQNAQGDYFPRYLEGAVKRHIGQRAEELSARAKAQLTSNKAPGNVDKKGRSKDKNLPAIPAARVVETIVGGVKKVEAIREVGAVETLAHLRAELVKEQRERREQRKAAKTKRSADSLSASSTKQETLF